nr:MAG TPA: hypothetical protein [Caudoviricetes sp.]
MSWGVCLFAAKIQATKYLRYSDICKKYIKNE